ncbi:isopentenyl-diphosphate delta-isomerase [Desulfomicrobium escambiense]|uniref:isopentenyl-diphosphate delta-isomerase n=1 Tax=Desulfomicrobium escambiense TaxID=29503 RepID=UPI00146F9D69|nr:isopentenyl-diphosphate delta-isomerase [Desulfomicrobium escambiense]
MSTESSPDRIYVVDAENRPLAVMSPEEVHAQGLSHRGVLLLLTDRRGRLALRRLPADHSLHPGRWDVAGSGHIGAEEAAEEAAQNRLPAAAADLGDSLRHVRTLNAGAGTGAEIVEVFEAELPDKAVQALAGDLSFLFVDRDELDALVSSFPEQLSPDLLTVWRTRLTNAPS